MYKPCLRRSKNNPILVGEPGVGKTALVEGVAQRIVRGDVPDELRGRVTSLRSYNSGFVILTSLLIGWVVDLTNVTLGIMAVGGTGLALSIVAIAALKRVRPLAQANSHRDI